MNKELKPCPFCGNINSIRVASSHEDIEDDYGNPECFQVVCDASTDNKLGGCGGAGGYMETAEEAIEVWNKRSPQERND